jgi:hypothetical protein
MSVTSDSDTSPSPGDTTRDYTAILENQMEEGIRTIERPPAASSSRHCLVDSTSDLGRCF